MHTSIGLALVVIAFLVFVGIFVGGERLPHWVVFLAAVAILVVGLGGVMFLVRGAPPQRRGD